MSYPFFWIGELIYSVGIENLPVEEFSNLASSVERSFLRLKLNGFPKRILVHAVKHRVWELSQFSKRILVHAVKHRVWELSQFPQGRIHLQIETRSL